MDWVWVVVLVGVALGGWFLFARSAAQERKKRQARVDPTDEVRRQVDAPITNAGVVPKIARVPPRDAPVAPEVIRRVEPRPEPVPGLERDPEPTPLSESTPELTIAPSPKPESEPPPQVDSVDLVEPAEPLDSVGVVDWTKTVATVPVPDPEPVEIEAEPPASAVVAVVASPEVAQAQPEVLETNPPLVEGVVEAPEIALAPLIFVVDDSTVVRTKLLRLLHKAGYRTAIAGDGHEALTLFEMDLPALMITDIEMPTMDGHELIARLQENERTRGVPIFAISAHESMAETLRGVPGVTGVHKKPWKNEALLASLLEHAGPGIPEEAHPK